LNLPTASGCLENYKLRGSVPLKPKSRMPFNRIAYSAAHVVSDPLASVDPWLQCAVDWDTTIDYRRHLWSLGLGVAEAMDTAQRGMGLDWPTSLELIRRTLGGKLIIMASRALARVATSPADYERVYDRILSQVKQPVVLHWLGDMFDPALLGYWGSADVEQAMGTALGIIQAHSKKVDGIKISLLDKDKEIAMRRRLPPGVRMYTGDDFNYAELIAGDGFGHDIVNGQSDALLGIFDAIAPAASAALTALAEGKLDTFHAILGPTVPLSRHIFMAPTRYYKTGVVFMAWLNGHQSHFSMIGGQQSTRSAQHLAELFRLADEANLLERPELAVHRMKILMATHGVA
jgi:hypothetical protein